MGMFSAFLAILGLVGAFLLGLHFGTPPAQRQKAFTKPPMLYVIIGMMVLGGFVSFWSTSGFGRRMGMGMGMGGMGCMGGMGGFY